MGHMKHHAIVVTSFDLSRLQDAMEAARLFKLTVSQPLCSSINKYWSFFVSPDGSKSGWEESDEGDNSRAEFKDWLKSKRECDGSSFFEWVEVSYSSDDEDALVTDSEWNEPSSEKDTPHATGGKDER